MLKTMRGKRLNSHPGPPESFTPAAGWPPTPFPQPLPGEPPGPPLNNGSFAAAKRLARNYDFAEPSIVRASWDPNEPLERRTMLLGLRFVGLRLYVGVRVGDVFEETRTEGGRVAWVWGWTYRTLEGHVEAGEMRWEIRKWLETGEVEFRIHAFSRWVADGNPLLRVALPLIGRREQLRFMRLTCRRMAALTAAAIGGEGQLT